MKRVRRNADGALWGIASAVVFVLLMGLSSNMYAANLGDAGRNKYVKTALKALNCLDAQSVEVARQAFDAHIASLPDKEQALYSQIFDNEEHQIEYYRRVTVARMYFSNGKFPWDDRGKTYVLLGAPAHISRSDDIHVATDPRVWTARTAFATRLSANVIPGFPTFPIPEGLEWENWVYPDIMGGIELTFVGPFSKKYVFAPLPGGFDRPAPIKLIGYQGQMLIESAKKKVEMKNNNRDLRAIRHYAKGE